MGLRINTNVVSLVAQRNVNQTSKSLARSLERLASGSRINRAGDDAAGLAISEGLGAQVRGLSVAIRNSNDAIGFLNTAEGALQELTNISQRLRELAIQASNGTLSDDDRGYLNDEAEQLISEFARISAQTEFNGVKLLDGSFGSTDLQVGINRGDTISFSIGDARASALGSIATISGVQHYILSTATSFTIGSTAISAPSSNDDTVSSAGNSWSAIAVAAAINEKEGSTGVKAIVLDNVVDLYDLSLGTSVWDGNFASDEFVINGVSITGSSVTTVGNLIDAINEKADSTGVRARLMATADGGTGNDIQLYANDGRNIRIQLSSTSASTAFYAVFQGGTVNFGAISLAFGASSISASWSAANRVITGAIKLVSAENISFASSASATLGFQGSSFVVNEDLAIDEVDLSTQDDAQDALNYIDQALNELNSLRASLGAIQNRLDSTVSNLSISLENISSARSQIRDADIAAETAELTRAQILQQAGIAVLGQANTSSQVALALLNF